MPSEWKNLAEVVEYAKLYSQQPIDQNYIAIPKDIWEDIERMANVDDVLMEKMIVFGNEIKELLS